jgi:hypothetical protein
VPDKPLRERQQIGVHLFKLRDTTPCVLHYDPPRRSWGDASRKPHQ